MRVNEKLGSIHNEHTAERPKALKGVRSVEDEKVIELFFARDEQALKTVEKKYGKLCFSVANNILHNRADAEECVNDALLALWESIPPERPEKFAAYLVKITRNKAIKRYEKNRAQKRGGGEYEVLLSELAVDIADSGKAEELLDEHLLTGVINSYLHSISEAKAAMFIQRYYMCYDIVEIAENTGKSVGSVLTSLCRMRGELKKRLEKEGYSL